MVEEPKNENSNQPSVKPPFHQRFNVQVYRKEVEKRFINRIINMSRSYLPELECRYNRADFINQTLIIVASALGESYHPTKYFSEYIGDDYFRCLLAVETLYGVLKNDSRHSIEAENMDKVIKYAVSASEIDLGIKYENGMFYPSGAKLLDDALINENLKWLSDQGYAGVLEPFEKGLRHFLEARKQPEKLADTVTDMYEALEAMARIATGMNKELSANKEKFISVLELSNHYKNMLNDYIDYGCEYRHAVKPGEKRKPAKRNEVEAFFYTTGLFIRLAIQQLTSAT